MTKTEETFYYNFNALNDTLENAIKFYFNAVFCIEMDYVNNKDYSNYVAFCDSFCVGSQIAMISFLNKLIDKTGFSINNLIQFVDKNPCMFKAVKEDTLSVINKIEKELTVYNEIIEILNKHRNEFHSHLGKNLANTPDVYNIFCEHKISIEQIENLLKFLAQSVSNIWNIFNDYSHPSAYIQWFLDNNKEGIYEMSDVKKAFNILRIK